MLRQNKLDHDPDNGPFPEPGEDSRYTVGLLASQVIIVKAKNIGRLTRADGRADEIVVMGFLFEPLHILLE